MNERLERMKQRVRDGAHRTTRQAIPIDFLGEPDVDGLSWLRRVARLVSQQCEKEQVVIDPDERIVFTRTLPGVPPI